MKHVAASSSLFRFKAAATCRRHPLRAAHPEPPVVPDMQSSSAMSSAPIAGLRARVVAKRVARRNVDRAIRAVSTERSAANNLGNEKLRSVAGAVAAEKDVSEKLKALIARGGGPGGRSRTTDQARRPEPRHGVRERRRGSTSRSRDGTVVVRGAAEAQITPRLLRRAREGPHRALPGGRSRRSRFRRGPRSRRREPAHQPRERVPEHAGDGEEAGESAERRSARERNRRSRRSSSPRTASARTASSRRRRRSTWSPTPTLVDELVNTLRAKKIGIVAHFYMDAQVQGVAAWRREKYEHVFISDSLVMADAAVKMVEAGCEPIAVWAWTSCPRTSRDPGRRGARRTRRCTAWPPRTSGARWRRRRSRSRTTRTSTRRIADGEPAAHVIYINTALDTKANANAIVPTVTCTSVNVVQTVLAAGRAGAGRERVLRAGHLHGREPRAPVRHDVDVDGRRGSGGAPRAHAASDQGAAPAAAVLPGRHVHGAPHVRRGRVRRGGEALRRRVLNRALRSARRDVQDSRCERSASGTWAWWVDEEHLDFVRREVDEAWTKTPRGERLSFVLGHGDRDGHRHRARGAESGCERQAPRRRPAWSARSSSRSPPTR